MICGHCTAAIVSSDEGTAYCRWCALEAENAALRVQVRTARESRKRLLRLIETIQVFLEIFGDNQAHNIVERCESMVCEFSALAAALSEQTLAQERARCARIADAVAEDFCADPDLPSGCQAAKTIADAIRSGEAAPSELATQCAELVRGLCCELSDGVLEMAVESLGRTNVEVIRRKRDAVLSALPDAVSQPQTSR